MDPGILAFVLLVALLSGANEEEDILGNFSERMISNSGSNSQSPHYQKTMRSQTFIRATTLGEFVEIERTDQDDRKEYKVKVKMEPFILTRPIKEMVKSDKIKIRLELNDIKVNGVNKFQIIGVSDKASGTADISFELPSAVNLNSTYKLDGILHGKKATGDGICSIDIYGMIMNGSVNILEDEKEMQLQNMDLSYTFENVKVDYTGLHVDGMTADDMKSNITDITKRYLKENAPTIGKRIAEELRYKLNKKLKGISVSKVISILKPTE